MLSVRHLVNSRLLVGKLEGSQVICIFLTAQVVNTLNSILSKGQLCKILCVKSFRTDTSGMVELSEPQIG